MPLLPAANVVRIPIGEGFAGHGPLEIHPESAPLKDFSGEEMSLAQLEWELGGDSGAADVHPQSMDTRCMDDELNMMQLEMELELPRPQTSNLEEIYDANWYLVYPIFCIHHLRIFEHQ